MLILFVLGMMNVVVLVIVTAAISLERLLPRPHLVGRASGEAAILGGLIAVFHGGQLL